MRDYYSMYEVQFSASKSTMSGNEEFIQEFLVECEENLDQLDQDLVALEQNPRDPDRLASIFRTMHTIKGTSGFFAFSKLGALAHAGESLLSHMRDGRLVLNADITTALLQLVDAVRAILSTIGSTGREGDGNYAPLAVRLTQLVQQPAPETPVSSIASPPLAADPPLIAEVPAPDDGAESAEAAQSPEPPVARDEDDHESVSDEPLGSDARPNRLTPVEAAANERVSADAGTPSIPSTSPLVSSDRPPSATAASSEQTQPVAGPGGPVSEGTIRVDVGLLNHLMDLVGELVLARNQILPFGDAIQERVFVNAVEQLDLITGELQEGIMKTRMQPIGNLWSKFPRVVRDLARGRNKQVHLDMEGEETELDRSLIEAIKDPLTHLVRNAVDHGIESPEQRVLQGKSESGHVALRAFHEGGMVNIEIADDGAGIDPDRVRQKALDMGLVTRDQVQKMSNHQLMQLIFLPGLSTARQVTDISGRGVGMDVVKTNIDRIGGSIAIESRPGQGTQVRIKIPLTLAIIPALIVMCQGERYAIPQVSLREIITLYDGEATEGVEIIDGAPVYRLRGELIPLVALHDILQLPRCENSRARTFSRFVVLQVIGRRFGLLVDEIKNTEEIVVKPLHKVLSQLQVFSGATIMGDGRVALILDVAGMARRAGIDERDQQASAHVPPPPQEPSAALRELLVCETATGRQVAVPLDDVARLEQRLFAEIEPASGREVLAYRGRVMPLLRMEPPARQSASADETVTIVVHAIGDCRIGLIVDRILDIVAASEQLDTSQRQPGILGHALIDTRVTEVIDIRDLARAAGMNLTDETCCGAGR